MSILGGRQRILFGTTIIEYELTYSERKTLAIHVYPDCSVVVDAPLGSSMTDIEQKIYKRGGWILHQQRQFQDYAPANPLPRRYVSGESYRYLGRQYRLKVIEGTVVGVRLSRGYLTVNIRDRNDRNQIAALLDGWYRSHAKRVFQERLKVCFPRVESLGVEDPPLAIRNMKSRWGSCTPSGRIILNLKLIQAPKDLIDYVILHELCHLKEHNHSPAFYALLDKVLPGWPTLKKRLNGTEFM